MTTTPDFFTLALVVGISGCEAVGQSVAFLARQAQSFSLLLSAWLIYAGVVYLLYTAYGSHGVGFVNALWSGVMTVMMLIIGRVWFNERLTRTQWIGISVILTGMVVLIL